MKRVAFDLRCLPVNGAPGAGIPHAARELFSACVERSAAFGLECVAYVVGDADVASAGNVVRLVPSTNHGVPAYGSGRLLARAVKADGCRAFFAPTGSIPLGVSLPSFAWVHDVAIFSHPEWFPQSWLRRQLTTRLFLHGLARARHVFCVSEDTKTALHHLLPRLSSSVSVTHEGVILPDTVVPVLERLDQVLVLGTVEPRKNIPFIVNLWPLICQRTHRSVSLMIAGSPGWGSVEVKTSKAIQRMSHVSEVERDQLLRYSKLVLVPSLHEGFGRVALEAMAHGTPVIVSRAGAHAEVVGEAGILLDPQDQAGWVEAIAHLLMDDAAWQRRQDEGRQRALQFSWSPIADRILAVIAKSC